MFDHFNLLAPIYENVIQPKPPERLSELLNLSPELNLLDIGGGTGRISQFFADSVKQVVVADTSFKRRHVYCIATLFTFFQNNFKFHYCLNYILNERCLFYKYILHIQKFPSKKLTGLFAE